MFNKEQNSYYAKHSCIEYYDNSYNVSFVEVNKHAYILKNLFQFIALLYRFTWRKRPFPDNVWWLQFHSDTTVGLTFSNFITPNLPILMCTPREGI